jgi:hypothetical protein
MSVLTKKEIRERARKQEKLYIEADYSAVQKRARSVTVGTSFGGTVEVMMRKADGDIIWATLQPVEVVELINQLAAGIGCHIHIQPRKDFASWRNWKYSEEELSHFRGANNINGTGHPPHAKSDGDEKYKTSLPAPEQQPGLQPAMMARSNGNEQTLATQKTVGRKRTKRAAAAA